jgi:hypothetical protein
MLYSFWGIFEICPKCYINFRAFDQNALNTIYILGHFDKMLCPKIILIKGSS